MTASKHLCIANFNILRRSFLVAPVLLLAFTLGSVGHAQTFTVLHYFTGGQDGRFPEAGLTMDTAGNLYGTTLGGGAGYGTVFKLMHKGSGWVFSPLYNFKGKGNGDGAGPEARVSIGPDGSLYGTTFAGGQGGCASGYDGCGTVFNLKPTPTRPATPLTQWVETVLYRFGSGNNDGVEPHGTLVFDQAGNIYGTTVGGNYSQGYGTVFKLARSGGNWTESVVYRFTGDNGANPESGLILDSAGNMYGTTSGGGSYGYGTVYELSPSGSGLTESTLYEFQGLGDGGSPFGGLILDKGNLYGATTLGGSGGGGTVFMLSPSSGGWTLNVLYSFDGGGCQFTGPTDSLIMNALGELYGTTHCDAYGLGSVFKLTPFNGGWTFGRIIDFTGEGANPWGNVILDAAGNLYGATFTGGLYSDGIVFEITP